MNSDKQEGKKSAPSKGGPLKGGPSSPDNPDLAKKKNKQDGMPGHLDLKQDLPPSRLTTKSDK